MLQQNTVAAHTARFIILFLQHTTDNYRPLNPQQLTTPANLAVGSGQWGAVVEQRRGPCRDYSTTPQRTRGGAPQQSVDDVLPAAHAVDLLAALVGSRAHLKVRAGGPAAGP